MNGLVALSVGDIVVFEILAGRAIDEAAKSKRPGLCRVVGIIVENRLGSYHL
jgi:hypothetical protein